MRDLIAAALVANHQAYSQFRHSDNVEDRRRQAYVRPPPGVFGSGQQPNIFESADGLMTGLRQEDFAPVPMHNPLGHQLGVEDIEQ